MDTRRSRYLIAYDIADSHRLYQMHKHVEAYAIGGQKSLYECWQKEHEMILTIVHLFLEFQIASTLCYSAKLHCNLIPHFYLFRRHYVELIY